MPSLAHTNPVTLNLFQGPFRCKPSFHLAGVKRADAEAAPCALKLSSAAQWVLKQVQDDYLGEGART